MNPLRLHRETIFSMRAVSVWSLLAMVLGRGLLLAGREETGERPEGKGFLNGGEEEIFEGSRIKADSVGCLFAGVGNNKASGGSHPPETL